MNPLKYLHGLDSYERHRAVAAIIKTLSSRDSTVLDVGGESGLRCNHLSRFCGPRRVTTINVKPNADIRSNGRQMALEASSFDVVASLDTLEHIPREDRPAFIDNLVRIARRLVVLCFPFESGEAGRVEQRLNLLYQDHNLMEHVACGLPHVSDLIEMEPSAIFLYDGSLRRFAREFVNLHKPLKLLRMLLGLIWLRPLSLRSEYDSDTRRCYMIIVK